MVDVISYEADELLIFCWWSVDVLLMLEKSVDILLTAPDLQEHPLIPNHQVTSHLHLIWGLATMAISWENNGTPYVNLTWWWLLIQVAEAPPQHLSLCSVEQTPCWHEISPLRHFPNLRQFNLTLGNFAEVQVGVVLLIAASAAAHMSGQVLTSLLIDFHKQKCT